VGLEEWSRGGFEVAVDGTPFIRMKDIRVRIRVFG
jgi:hypothetical protein